MPQAEFSSLDHWRVSYGSSGHCWLTFDKAGHSPNTLSRSVIDELEIVISHLEQRVDLPGLIVRSGKSSGFILGADVAEFVAIDEASQAASLAARGQALFRRLEELPCPTVALLNGYTLGGGLELALACRYRVAVLGYERCIGLPEVQLGIHPGFGGTVRAVEKLGVIRAFELMLTGRSLSPFEARKIGLVDALAAPGDAEGAVLRLLRRRPPPRRAPWFLRLLNYRAARTLLARRLRAQVARKTRQAHYPAPFALIELWERYGAAGPEAYRAEADSLGRLLVSQTSKNLVRLFQLRERLKNLAPKSNAVARIHVVGGGVMGGDIAAWCALQGLQVTVQDREQKYLEPAFARAQTLFRKRLKAPGAAADAAARLVADLEGAGVAEADIVVEAIIEDLDAKRALFVELEQRVRADTILATNTSSIRIEDIAAPLQEPQRLLGIHYFNPVASMPLVEVIRTPDTDAKVFDRALAFVAQTGKLPLPCASAPGFLVNRILMPYMLEALRAHEEGLAAETIDAAAREFGMPMGPVELADQVGLDVALHVAEILAPHLGVAPPDRLREMVAAGRLGRKSSGGGFYRYERSRPVRAKDAPRPDQILIDRLILTLVNEAVACLAAGVVDDADLLDAGVVFGTGFAPFTGGPISYARQCGREKIMQRLAALQKSLGERFRPHPGWDEILPAR
jgi:3-hydroxyacyl-CoA dehydrogenase/enoyl-CoA hydratase/3-hydroxybutyryl-CoA epimerase